MKKISILGLHLGYGGIEQSIVNQANALCDNYKVELVVSYKLLDEPSFKVNTKVTIKYLTKVIPNKTEFLNYMKNKKLFSAFKEGLKSIKILYLKKSTMKKYIKNCDSDIIISSRVEIAKLLGKYKPNNSITITEEHCHHNNNKKYINNLKKVCKKIDYLVLVSKELTEFYSKIIIGAKCFYIPNGLNDLPNKISKLDNKNIVSVGRLSSEKGYLDLIDVFKIINEKDSSIHLDIIGNGSEYPKIYNKIKEYHLENNITLHGYQNKDYIGKMMLNSSLYVMCSYEESFGIVLIEAGSYGIPAIAFDSAQGANEIIINNKSGYLVKNRNNEEMANKILTLINNNNLLRKMGKEARNISENYSFESTKQKWLDFVMAILKNKD